MDLFAFQFVLQHLCILQFVASRVYHKVIALLLNIHIVSYELLTTFSFTSFAAYVS